MRERNGKRSGAGRNRAERSVERAWQKRMERKRSAAREVAERQRSGMRRGGLHKYINRLERGAAFSQLLQAD